MKRMICATARNRVACVWNLGQHSVLARRANLDRPPRVRARAIFVPKACRGGARLLARARFATDGIVRAPATASQVRLKPAFAHARVFQVRTPREATTPGAAISTVSTAAYRDALGERADCLSIDRLQKTVTPRRHVVHDPVVGRAAFEPFFRLAPSASRLPGAGIHVALHGAHVLVEVTPRLAMLRVRRCRPPGHGVALEKAVSWIAE